MSTRSIDLEALRHVLAGRSLNQVGDSLLDATVRVPLKAGEMRSTVRGELSVRVLNRPEDRDEDGVFGEGAHIGFDLESAWLKYKVTTNHDTRLPLASASLKRGSEVELSDYRVHPATEDAWQSLRRDLVELRTLLEVEDVKKLEPGEALALEIGGTLTTSVGFSWSDAIAERFRDLVRDLPVAQSFSIRLRAGVDASAAIKVEDQFSLVVSRTREGSFRIAVKKARSRNHTFGLGVSLGADVSAVPAIESALEPLFESITGVALEAAEHLAQRIGVGTLSTEETAFVDRLAAVFDLETSEDRDEAVRDAIGKLRRKLRERLNEIGRWKAAITFASEYSSIEENTSIADYVVDDVADLERDHALLLAGDFGAITSSLRGDAGSRTLIRYLNETTLTQRASSGFSIGIGKWMNVEAKDESVLRLTKRTSVDGFRLLHYRGVQRYRERLIPQNDFEWTVELRAAMHEYAERPVSLDFHYAIRYAVTLERGFLAEADLARMVDFARMWNIAIADERLFAEAIGRKATVKVQFRLDGDELLSALGGNGEDADWATALAAAMPYASFFPERRTFTARIATYRDAWAAWLHDASVDVEPLLRPAIRSGLALLEEPNLPGSFRWTAETGHPQLRRRLEAFIRGTATLREAIAEAHPPETIAAAYTALRQFWSQRLYVAASGQWLLARAERAGADVNRSLQIDLGSHTITG